MIQRDLKNIRAYKGDFEPVSVYAGDKKAQGWEISGASGKEIEIKNTYNAPYEALKVFGKSEQKAKWNQAEGVTNQNGEPSPESPVDLISNISAGSYQIPTENGIYEVTLTEDLRGLDDTYRDKICFDSVSGKGYRENNTQLVRLTRSNMKPYRNTSDVTYRLQGTNVLLSTIPKTNANASVFCNRLKRYHLLTDLVANDIVGISSYTEGGMTNNNIYIFLSKSDIGITADDTADTMQEKAYTYLDENPLYILVGGYSYREELTFTKVSSSTLPVLPWTAYGENLLDNNAFNFDFVGTENKEVIIPVNAKTTGEYTISCTVTDKSDITYSSSGSLVSLEFKYSDDTDSYGSLASVADWVGDVTESTSNPYKKLKQIRIWKHDRFISGTIKLSNIMLNIGQLKAYEPFNLTPPESLIPSPDYPQQIYDLKDVTVTSRGRNLFDKGWINNIDESYVNNTYHCTDGVYDVRYPVYYDYLSCITANYPTIKPGNYTIAFDCMIPANTQNTKKVAVGLRKPPLGVYFLMPEGRYFALNNNDVWQKVVKSFTVTEETEYALNIQPAGVTDYSVTVYFKNIQIVEGTYTADTLPPFDKYRCTSATIPLTLRSCGDDKDCLQNDGQAVNLYEYIKGVTIDGTLNNFVCNVVGSASSQACSFFVKYNGTNYDRLKADSTISNTHGFTAVPKSDSGNYLPYITIPWSVLGLTSAPTTSEANEAAKSYCAEQNALGTPLIMRYVLYTPVETDCTDTWAQDLLGLKTAPYYTKLFADKETGGLSAKYKHF